MQTLALKLTLQEKNGFEVIYFSVKTDVSSQFKTKKGIFKYFYDV